MPWIVLKKALYFTYEGQEECAEDDYALASRYPGVTESRWLEQVLGRHITDVSDRLRPEAVAAAKDRWRARHLDVLSDELLPELEGAVTVDN